MAFAAWATGNLWSIPQPGVYWRGLALAATCLLLIGAALVLDRKPEGLEIGAFMIAIVVLPILLMRFPLATHFGWFASKLIVSVFRDELAALSRADQGTFLARLASAEGKK